MRPSRRDRSARSGGQPAALAVWAYCEQSALYLFGDRPGDAVAERIWTALCDARCIGATLSASTCSRGGVPAGAGELERWPSKRARIVRRRRAPTAAPSDRFSSVGAASGLRAWARERNDTVTEGRRGSPRHRTARSLQRLPPSRSLRPSYSSGPQASLWLTAFTPQAERP